MITYDQAKDLLFENIHTAWLADPISQGIVMLFDDVAGDKPKPPATGPADPYARMAMRHNHGTQDSFGAIGNRRYLNGGVFTVQIFTPVGDGLTLAGQLIGIVVAALRSQRSPTGVWILDIIPNEIGPDGPWFQTNVDAVFRYQDRA